MTAEPRERTLGAVFAATAYLLWGFLPLYFLALAPTSAWEVVAWRIIFSLAFCALLIVVTRSWPKLAKIFSDRRTLALTALAGLLIYVNWQVFLLATLTGHIVETAMGYFLNPIVTILLGVVVLRERLRPLQWGAVGLVACAVIILVVGYRSFPWMALTLAASFGIYSLVKKQIGPKVDAVSGLTLESLWLVPIAIAQLIAVSATGGITFGTVSGLHTTLLVLAGAVTAVPLLFFAAATRRSTLTVIGILQFIAPIMQFVTGVWVKHEPMPIERWIGFGVVWLALALFVIDTLMKVRRRRIER